MNTASKDNANASAIDDLTLVGEPNEDKEKHCSAWHFVKFYRVISNGQLRSLQILLLPERVK
jgi:hypothetical protein